VPILDVRKRTGKRQSAGFKRPVVVSILVKLRDQGICGFEATSKARQSGPASLNAETIDTLDTLGRWLGGRPLAAARDSLFSLDRCSFPKPENKGIVTNAVRRLREASLCGFAAQNSAR